MAVRFDAAGEHYANANPATGSLHTILLWGRVASGTGEQGFLGYSQSATVGTTGAVGIVRQASGNLVVDVANVGASSWGAISNSTWYCIALVRTSATAGTLYAGTSPSSLSSVAVDFTSATTAPITFTIGNWTYDTWLNGSVAAVKHYSVALTAAEIAAELGQYQPRRLANLVRWHPFLAPATVDYSGNGNTLTGGSGASGEDGPPIVWGTRRSSRVGSSGPKVIALLSVPSAESVGLPSLRQIIAPPSVPSAGSVGLPSLGAVIRPPSVGSAESVGTPSVVRLGTIDMISVPTAGSVGLPVLIPGPVSVQLLSVPSAESVGTPIVTIVIDLTKLVRNRRNRRTRRVPEYELLVMARGQQPAGPPNFTDVAAMTWKTLGWGSTLSRPQSLTVKCLVSSIGEQIAQRLRTPDRLPTELWLLRDGAQVFAGPWMTGSRDGGELTINASGLLVYLQGMFVRQNMRFDQVDQFTIAAQLIDQWQTQPYCHFGIDTSAVGVSGQLRDGSYIRNEKNWVAQRVEELGARRNGFDSEIDPTTRRLQLWSPIKGVDRSVGEDKVVFDRRNTGGENGMFSIAPGDLASIAIGTSTASGSDTTLWSEQVNDDLLKAYGGFAVDGSWSDIENQATLDGHVGQLLDDRDQPLRSPGRQVRVTPDSPLTRYDVGDTVDYEIDSLLGVGGAFRLQSRYINLAPNGAELVDVEFV